MKTAQEQRAWEAQEAGLPARLLEVLRRRTGAAGLEYAEAPSALLGGHWASLYGFRLRGAPADLAGDLVLRVMPTGDDQCLREATIQAALAAAGFPAPRVHLSGGRDAGFGFPFILMERIDGEPSSRGDARLLWRLPVLLGETMARLHNVDEGSISRALAEAGARPAGVTTLLADLAERSVPLAGRGFVAGAAWLREHQPSPGAHAVCHGDLHPFNLMLARQRVSGLIDWTQALLADPAFDVAYTAQLLTLWPIEVSLVPRPLGRLAGRFAAHRFVRAYRRHARKMPGELAWYEALHSLRILLRVASARSGLTVPPLGERHPWELVAADAARAFLRRSGVHIALPPR